MIKYLISKTIIIYVNPNYYKIHFTKKTVLCNLFCFPTVINVTNNNLLLKIYKIENEHLGHFVLGLLIRRSIAVRSIAVRSFCI